MPETDDKSKSIEPATFLEEGKQTLLPPKLELAKSETTLKTEAVRPRRCTIISQETAGQGPGLERFALLLHVRCLLHHDGPHQQVVGVNAQHRGARAWPAFVFADSSSLF